MKDILEAIRAIEAQNHEEKDLAKRAITWIARAEWPLTIQQICCAVATGTLGDKERPEVDKGAVLSACDGLIVIDPETDIVSFVDQGTKEHFEQNMETWNPKAQLDIATTCLQYLSSEAFQSGSCSTPEVLDQRQKDNPLFEYAARNWGNHIETVQTEALDLALPFLLHEGTVSSAGQVIFDSNLASSARHNVNPAPIRPRVPKPGHLGSRCEEALRKETSGSSSIVPKKGGEEDNESELAEELNFDVQYEEYDDDDEEDYEEYEEEEDDDGAEEPQGIANTHSGEPLDHQNATTSFHITAWFGLNYLMSQILTRMEKEKVEKALNREDNWRLIPLLIAVERSNPDTIKTLLDARADVNVRKKDSNATGLHIASEIGNLAAIEILLKSGADINTQDSPGRTPLDAALQFGQDTAAHFLIDQGAEVKAPRNSYYWATFSGREEGIKLLIKNGCEISYTGQNGSLLHLAVETACPAVVSTLLANGAVVDATNEPAGDTALFLATQSGYKVIVQELLKHGAQVDLKSGQAGIAPLVTAAETGDKELVKILLDHGASIDIRSGASSVTALQVAAGREYEEIVEMLLANGADVNLKMNSGRSALHEAAVVGNEKIVLMLLDKGADINACSFHNSSVLLYLLLQKHERLAGVLIERGCNVNIQRRDGPTPLSVAASKGYENIVQMLISKGADMNAVWRDGSTALHMALFGKSERVVELLLDNGANPNSQRRMDGITALHIASYEGREGIARVLVSKGAAVDVPRFGGFTSLHEAATAGRKEISEMLIENGANINAPSMEHRLTPLHQAAYNGHAQVVEMLLSKGANINAKDSRGLNAVRSANMKHHLNIVQMLRERGADDDAEDKVELAVNRIQMALSGQRIPS